MKLKNARLGAAKIALLAIVVVGFYISGCGGSSSSSPPDGRSPKLSAGACAGNELSFFNNNSYPVWLAEAYQGPVSKLSANTILPPAGDWEIPAHGNATNMCMPAGWTGRFWPRTECNFQKYFGSDPGYRSCTTSSECDSSHVCYGGKCMLKCNVDSNGAKLCQNDLTSKAICMPDGAQPPKGKSTLPGVCTYSEGTVCKTGDCSGLYQCYGKWGTLIATEGATGPVSLFEPTSNSKTSVNYDVSHVNGYNTAIAVIPSVTPSSAQPANCYAPACTSDLNSSCPSDLQVTEAPTTTQSNIPCGTGTYCQSGWCDTTNDMCVIGCNDPADQCETATPPPGLDCTSTVPNSSVTYQDMYEAKNTADGHSMSSGNQGTATCWGSADCAPGETCNMTAVTSFPSGVGICVPTSGTLQLQTNCHRQQDVGNACGGYQSDKYPNALNYQCVSIGSGKHDVACVPAQTSGLGTLETAPGQPPLYSATGSPLNPAWLTAVQQAGGNGTAYYKAFTAACPHEYGWQYDDHAGGFACQEASGNPPVNFTIVFGLLGVPATP